MSGLTISLVTYLITIIISVFVALFIKLFVFIMLKVGKPVQESEEDSFDYSVNSADEENEIAAVIAIAKSKANE